MDQIETLDGYCPACGEHAERITWGDDPEEFVKCDNPRCGARRKRGELLVQMRQVIRAVPA